MEPKSIPTTRPSTVFLDGVRGLAAVFIVVHHALLWLHPGYLNGYVKHPEQYSRFAKIEFALFYPFRFGSTAVVLFFVLSGFVIHLRYATQAASGRQLRFYEYGYFLYRRARRLYPPLLLAISLTYAADQAGAALGFPIYSHQTPYDVINVNIGNNHHLRTLFGNLAFVMQTYVPVWGSDAPLWSLKYEWWFYAVYPLTWLMLLNRSPWPATAVICIAAFMSRFPHLWPVLLASDIAAKMLVWWVGALLAEAYVGRLAAGLDVLSVLTLLIPVAISMSIVQRPVPDLVWALGFAGLLSLGLTHVRNGGRLFWLECLKPLGDCSYTLYVIHAPLLIFASGWLMQRSKTHELPASFLPALCSAAILPVAYVLHFIFERPFVHSQRRNTPPPLTSDEQCSLQITGCAG